MNATSLEHKLIVIKQSVTPAGHAAVRPLSLLPEPLACVAWPGGSPAGPAPCRAAAPAGCDQSCAAAPGPCHSALQRREPSAGHRPPAEPAELGRPRISPSCRVGRPLAVPDAATVGASGSARKRARPAPKGPPPVVTSGRLRPLRASRLVLRTAPVGTREEAAATSGWRVPPGGGRLGLAAAPLLGLSRCLARDSHLPIAPRRGEHRSGGAVRHAPVAPLHSPGSPLECPSRRSGCLPAPQPGLPGIVGTRLAPGPPA